MYDLNRREKTNLAIAAISIFAVGCVSVLFFLGFIGGISGPLALPVGYAIVALFVIGGVLGFVYIIFILVTGGWR
jgi:hypothetical protein